jgi:transposase-like protein
MTTAKRSRGFESCGVEAGPQAKRRSWSMAERRRMVEAALAPGASVAGVARAHDVNSNLVFKWIRRSREGWRDRRRALRRSPGADAAPSFVPVRLSYCARTNGAEGCGRRGGRRAEPAV